ncbi:nitrous oxide reductase family maturation protein NosD [Halegenticoccus tardaugens]|uniref:nitrous oxide reductase family maturation protein NosD n=1 Tax=Halegenticoccus tardaugens TaxID=2071624 RepID=UPI00100B2F71|nr:nitrous oxide reductase family maturation protein NosD [Halegenticoccus tardaugens]
MRERYFAVVAAAVLVCSVAGSAVAGTDGPAWDETTENWRPDAPDVTDAHEPDAPGVATVDGEEYDSVQAAVDAADRGETVVLDGRFDETVTVETPGVTVEAAERDGALIDGGGDGSVLAVEAANVTVKNVWLRNSGTDRSDEDAGVFVNDSDATLSAIRLTEVTFGIWVDGVDGATVEGAEIAGDEELSANERGNGIHLWEVDDAVVEDNAITRTRDGIYYSWSEGVRAEDNVVWDLRYGVHYMYSNDNHLENNTAFDNHIGFALMVSEELSLVNNTAVGNDEGSGHGIQLKDVEDSEISGNDLVANGDGFYVHNAQDNDLADNLVLENDVGIHIAAGSRGQRVAGNSFIANDVSAFAETTEQERWNGTDAGNYWSDASAVDLDDDGTSEVRHQPAGAVERLVRDRPRAAAFADSPAFDAIRLAESSFPVVESPGIVDHRPLAEPNHDDWESYYETHDH